MLTYNTQLKKLTLPEYGRNIQKMVDHCMTIGNKDERTACAYSIVKAMSTLFPSQGNPEEYHRKLWDHLAIMSDFALDIDWPFEVLRPDSLELRPDPVPLPYNELQQRQYGKVLTDMIDFAAQMEPSHERDALAIQLANQMKKLICISNDGADDAKIFQDLAYLSHGELVFSPEDVKLNEYKALPAPSKKKKKK